MFFNAFYQLNNTATFGADTIRIKESNLSQGINELIKKLSSNEYIKTVKKLAEKGFSEIKNLQTYVLTPVAIARLQKIINQFLIVKYEEYKANNKLKIQVAILESCVPCWTPQAFLFH